ncbi:MAG: DUF3772 domain-containing protein [Pseudomonadota bacterium]
MRRLLRHTAAALVLAALAVLLQAAAPGFAPVTAAAAQDQVPIDYAGWERDAARAESLISDTRATSEALDDLRTRVVGWRTRLSEAQSASSARIETLRTQIAALGPAPADGATESPLIAQRRAELGDQLARIEAPGIAAAEALGRAEGIVREIDRIQRERQARALLRLLPTPLNPVNWPAGFAVLDQGMRTLWTEATQAWADPKGRTRLRNNLPVVILLLSIAVVLVLKGPGFMERLTARLQRMVLRARHVAAALVSLGQVILPVAGTVLLTTAVIATGMTGPRSTALLVALPEAAFALFATLWLGYWLFPPRDEAADRGAVLTDRPAEGRFLTRSIGLVLALELLRRAFTTEVRPPLSLAAQAVWGAPMVFIAAVFILRLGLLLRQGAQIRTGEAEVLFRTRLIGLAGTATVAVSVLAPVLAAVGYIAAANALIWPTILSLGLTGFIILLQRFGTDIYLAVTGGDESQRDALIPVLLGFALAVMALPLFALIWGARSADLAETWARFLAGVSIGGTRISPTAFLTFAVVFAAGYTVTRLLQGALRSSVLPRTRLDKGSQNAVGVGVGYLGVFLAALLAINAAGIDLSSLAIVAGALSVGLGFGLQNIVQNFVSGIILLVERPVSEGDMIEVGGKMGIVRAISVRSTRIETFDRTELIVPNGDLITGVVTNWTRNNQTSRLVVPLSVAFGTDTRRVCVILREIADAQPAVLIDPEPSVAFMGFGADGMNFELRAIVSDVNFKGDVQTEILHCVVERFAAEGIEIPFPQRDLWLRNPDALAGLGPVQGRTAAAAAGRSAPADPAGPQAGAAAAPAAPAAIRNDPREGEDPDRS